MRQPPVVAVVPQFIFDTAPPGVAVTLQVQNLKKIKFLKGHLVPLKCKKAFQRAAQTPMESTPYFALELAALPQTP